MKKSHIAGWTSESPTPAQFAEFFRQCQSPNPRITKDRLQLFLRGNDQPPLGYDLARSILGRDFITAEEITETRGLVYTEDHFQMFRDTLPSGEVLKYCRDHGLMLVAGPPRPMNLLEIRDLKPEYFYSKSDGWYTEECQKFSRDDKANPCWLALRKEPVPGSTGKNWEEQSKLISDAERVPNSTEAIWGLITYKAVRDIYLLPSLYVRTSSLVSDGVRVDVGSFDRRGLNVHSYWDDNRYGGIGLAASLKFQTEN